MTQYDFMTRYISTTSPASTNPPDSKPENEPGRARKQPSHLPRTAYELDGRHLPPGHPARTRPSWRRCPYPQPGRSCVKAARRTSQSGAATRMGVRMVARRHLHPPAGTWEPNVKRAQTTVPTCSLPGAKSSGLDRRESACGAPRTCPLTCWRTVAGHHHAEVASICANHYGHRPVSPAAYHKGSFRCDVLTRLGHAGQPEIRVRRPIT